MKKTLLILISALIILTALAGCSDPLKDGYKKNTTTTSATEKETVKKDYEDTLEGLKLYMVDKGYVNSKDEGIKMSAELIGAKQGYLYTDGAVKIELYEFNTKKLNKDAQKVIDSVNKNGYYTIYETNIKAYLTKDNKYMMIYNDAEKNIEREKQAIADFQDFNY